MKRLPFTPIYGSVERHEEYLLHWYRNRAQGRREIGRPFVIRMARYYVATIRKLREEVAA